MAANEKYNDLGLDGLESETLLHDEDSLSGLDDLDNFELDSDLDLNLDDAAFDDDPSADDLDNLDNLDYSSVESDNDAAISGDDAPIESNMSDNDIVDYPDAIDTTGEPTEIGEEDLSDDDLDLSLETNVDEDEDTAPITPDISDDDIANFDSDSFDDEDESDDDDDDDAYGVDLKIGPVTIAFTQVVEPEESADENDVAADDELNDFGDFGDADLSGDDDLEEETELASEETDESFADENEITDTEAELADDFSDIDDLTEEESATEEETNNEEENYDISSDDDLEFDVEQDEALSDIDIDDVLEQNGDESGKMLNIPMPHEDELVVDEEQNAFLSSDAEDVISDFAEKEAAADIESTEESGEDDALTELENNEITDSGISDDLTGFDETIDDLNSIGGADSNLISDDDLTALEESMPTEDEESESDENLTEATLAGDVVVDEALAESIESSDGDDDDERIALDGDEDLGIDLDNAETVQDDTADDIAAETFGDDVNTAETEISLDEDLPDTLDEVSDADTITEEIADESDITDEMPSDVGSLDDLDVDDIPAPTSFDEDDEDETIGLSGDELDNILVDADMSEAEMVDVDIPPTDEELADSINIPEDPSFENDDEFLSDEELAASVTIPGENEAAAEIEEPSVVDNNIMTNGDLDLYENVDENGGIIEDVEDTKIISDNNNGVEEISDHTIVVPATDDTLSDGIEDTELSDDIIDNAAELETDTIEKSADEIGGENPEDESETIDLSSFDADLDVDDNIDTDSQDAAEDESETIDLSSFDADLEPTEGIADFNADDGVSDEDMNAIADELEDTKIDISEEETNQIYDSLQNEESADENADVASEVNTDLKKDIKNVLTCLDSLLGALPEEKIKEFAESKEFEAYRRLFEQLDIKHE